MLVFSFVYTFLENAYCILFEAVENIIDDTLSIVRNVFIESVLLEGSWENKVNMILLEY